MSKIIGVTVGTPHNPKKIAESLTFEDLGLAFDDTLKFNSETNKLSVNTADKVEQDNTKPVTSAAVYTVVGNINAILESL